MTPGILIVTRNNRALSKRTLASALSQNIPARTLVVDNDSTDGTRDWLKTKDVDWIMLDGQKSLAASWNLGLRALWLSGCGPILVLNNDVEIRMDALSMLSDHGGEFVTCVSVSTREQMGVAGDRDLPVLRAVERAHPDFSAFLIRQSVVERVGWFDESFFPAYAEDGDMHVRMHRAGVRAVCLDLPFLHYSASTLKSASPGEAERIRRGAGKNRERFRLKYGCVMGSEEYERLFV